MSQNYYTILGINQDASTQDIKKAYRSLAKIYHPDINSSSEAQQMILLVREAYDVLIDPYQRNLYDLSLEMHVSFEQVQQEQEVSAAEKKRREYKQRKAKEDREYYEKVLRFRVNFYQFQRYASIFFIIISFVFSLDYFIHNRHRDISIEKVKTNHYGDAYFVDAGKTIATDKSFMDIFNESEPNVRIFYSYIFDFPVYMYYQDIRYEIKGNLYFFDNMFSYLMIIISILLLIEKKYKDWALTLGIVPWFFLLILGFLLFAEYFGSGY